MVLGQRDSCPARHTGRWWAASLFGNELQGSEGVTHLALRFSAILSCFYQSTLGVRKTTVAVLTSACCPQGSLSTRVPARLVCSCRTMARRVRQVRRNTGIAGTGGPGLVTVAVTSLSVSKVNMAASSQGSAPSIATSGAGVHGLLWAVFDP